MHVCPGATFKTHSETDAETDAESGENSRVRRARLARLARLATARRPDGGAMMAGTSLGGPGGSSLEEES